MRHVLALTALAGMLGLVPGCEAPHAPLPHQGVYGGADVPAVPKPTHARVELYFGLSTPGGGMVTDAEWENFLLQVTKWFPDGFTVVPASGQWREASGRIAREPSRVLVVVVPWADGHPADADALEDLARAYCSRFKQEAVMMTVSPMYVQFVDGKPSTSRPAGAQWMWEGRRRSGARRNGWREACECRFGRVV